MPSCREISLPTATSSPVTIFTRSPWAMVRSIVSFESSRGGSSRERRPRKRQWVPPSADSATPSARMPLAARSETAFSARVRSSPASAHNSKITWGAPFA